MTWIHAPAALYPQRRGGQVYIPRVGPATLTAVETTGPAEYNPSQVRLGYMPLWPFHSQRWQDQQHSPQWRQPAQRATDTVNRRPAQQRPCGRDNRPGRMHVSKPTPPLCFNGPNNAAADDIQASRSKQWGARVTHPFRLPPTLLAKTGVTGAIVALMSHTDSSRPFNSQSCFLKHHQRLRATIILCVPAN